MKPIVLCRLPNHVGDCCMTLPALRLLDASGFTPYLLGKRFAEDLMMGMGWRFDPIEGHVTEDFKRLPYLSKQLNRPLGLLFPNSFTSALQFRLAGIRSAGFGTDGRFFILDKTLPQPASDVHEVERFFKVAYEAIKAWGGTPAWDKPTPDLGLTLMQRHLAGAKNMRAELQIPERYALIAPIARGVHHGKIKHWVHINTLCQPLRDMGIEPIVLPSPDEVQEAKAACPDARHLEPTNLGTYAALCKDAQIVIANDSGISHVAAAVGARQLTLIGVTDPKRTGPWNPNATVMGSEQGWPEPDAVIAKLRELLA